MKKLVIIILAGGLGKRMNSIVPKVLLHINGVSMLSKVTDLALSLNPTKILIVINNTIINHPEFKIKQTNTIKLINQHQPKGTGDAVKCCLPHLIPDSNVLILSGDVPLLKQQTIEHFIKNGPDSVLVTKVENPTGFGRIIFEEKNEEKNEEKKLIQKIVEEKDSTEEEKKINIVNTGIYYLSFDKIMNNILQLNNNNNSKEYYLTYLIKQCKCYLSTDYIQFLNINTQHELLLANNT